MLLFAYMVTAATFASMAGMVLLTLSALIIGSVFVVMELRDHL